MPSVFLKTYGCQMNERDTEAVAAQLIAHGYALAPDETSADVVLLNTCSVRDLAEQKALGKMTNLAGAARKQGRQPILGFLGCMAQSRGQQLLETRPEVRLVIGTQKFHRTATHLDDLFHGRRQRIVDTEAEAGSQGTIREHLIPPAGPRPVTAFISIMQGCNQHCTFCIVPATRGEERSRTIPDIVAEARELVARGVREITLLGQIVTSFGRRDYPLKDGKSAFVQLIEAVHEIDGLERIRFTSPHPKGYGEDLIEAFGRLPKLVEHAHLPVQSGSDRILKQMHRSYTRERYQTIVERLRSISPEIGITTDIIVGFPGETEDDFGETVSLCRDLGFDQAYVFKYSPRRDTPAAVMTGQLPDEVIEERHRRLLDLINEQASRKYAEQVGRTVQILVEGPSRRNAARFEGRTRSNRIVVFEGSERHRGQLLDVKIERAGPFTLYGDPALVGFEEEVNPSAYAMTS
ncbi:MAG TPA: tRNA (N6-isopentenyl adenosine(37)-C2)-methylthiotransferase MiaB [Verrucomicrobiota bacterium]|nr:tRNA (N6-isopentenyl adenosine(37)-C2)-methylthiotransferase MiaB [Verrucomicrobiales bacterium]HRI13429.1 tRNA (N6-isopentenyl adenosine(37)-C2)-methylthiotransferase MiaB [Verrucomicrobiota bacterium]